MLESSNCTTYLTSFFRILEILRESILDDKIRIIEKVVSPETKIGKKLNTENVISGNIVPLDTEVGLLVVGLPNAQRVPQVRRIFPPYPFSS